ncbi:hypothetical protein [Phenylobacterium sp.]|uniref:hypothetical protein n=1 Tax=Phenylobacterium sp. TaxID=1871053 RepID=UPI003983206A
MANYPDAFGDADPQDSAESLDETNYDDDLGEMRTFEELPDVLDVTQAVGDRDDDEALALDADEFDPDAIDDDDPEEDNELDYRAATEEHEDDLDGLGPEAGSRGIDEDALSASDIDGLDEVRDAGQISGKDNITRFQSHDVGDEDLTAMGYDKPVPGKA